MPPRHRLLERQRPACLRRKGHFLPWLRSSGQHPRRAGGPRPARTARAERRPPAPLDHPLRRRRAPRLQRRRPVLPPAPDLVETSLGDCRTSTARAASSSPTSAALVVANIYFPNGNGQRARQQPRALQARRSIATCSRGSASCAPPASGSRARRLQHGARRDRPRPPAPEREASGFLPEERAELTRWLAGGWVDTFRKLQPRARPLLVVVAARGRPRAQRRLAPRLRARVPGRGPFLRAASDPPGGHRLGPLPRQRRRRPRRLRPHRRPA
jgi:hypothetical protein